MLTPGEFLQWAQFRGALELATGQVESLQGQGREWKFKHGIDESLEVNIKTRELVQP